MILALIDQCRRAELSTCLRDSSAQTVFGQGCAYRSHQKLSIEVMVSGIHRANWWTGMHRSQPPEAIDRGEGVWVAAYHPFMM